MAFQRLRFKDWITVAVACALAYAWIRVDQEFVPSRHLMTAFVLVMTAISIAVFYRIRPRSAWALASTLSLGIGIVGAALIVVQHVLIRFDLSRRSVIVLAVAMLLPFVAGALYRVTRG